MTGKIRIERRSAQAAGALGLACCLAAAVATPAAVASRPPDADPAGAPAVEWRTCSDDVLGRLPVGSRDRYSCATYQVPLDYRRPSPGTIELAMLRRAAEDPAHRIGSLFLNPGGPGGSGLFMPAEAAAVLPSEIIQRFDLVGFDPRGVGASAPLRCFTTQEDADAVFSRIVDVPVTPAEITATLAANHDYTTACAANAGPLLNHMSTLDTAHDLDRLRQGIGDRRLNYLGFSYGTLLGATYVNLYPKRARAIVLDGNVDPVLRTSNGLEYLRQRAAGQEGVVDAFLALCAQVGERCSFSAGGDPATKFAEIRTRLRAGLVDVPALGGPISLSGFTNGVARLLYDASSYPDLANALQAIHETIHPTAVAPTAASRAVRQVFGFGDKDPQGLRDVGPRWADMPYTDDDSALGINCTDEPFPRDLGAFVRAADRWEAESPTTGRAHAYSQVACATWPTVHPERYTGPYDRRTDTPVLLFGNYQDPATNYAFSQRMAAELGADRLVSVDAFGHTILGGQSACADTAAVRYLVDLTLPQPGTVCQPDHQPFG